MKLVRIFAAALLLGATSIALAEPIKLIIPTAPGGGTDGFFRVLAKEATPFIKDPIVVVNVPGAGGTIGVAQMVHASPDGQTLAAVWLGPGTVSPHTMKVQYTPNDYIPVIQLTSAPYVFCVHPDFPATEGKSFIEELRKNPDKYTYGNDGAGGPGQLAAERIFRAMKVRARDIPFKGAGETATAFLGKHIDIYDGSVPPVLQHAQGEASPVLHDHAEQQEAEGPVSNLLLFNLRSSARAPHARPPVAAHQSGHSTLSERGDSAGVHSEPAVVVCRTRRPV